MELACDLTLVLILLAAESLLPLMPVSLSAATVARALLRGRGSYWDVYRHLRRAQLAAWHPQGQAQLPRAPPGARDAQATHLHGAKSSPVRVFVQEHPDFDRRGAI